MNFSDGVDMNDIKVRAHSAASAENPPMSNGHALPSQGPMGKGGSCITLACLQASEMNSRSSLQLI